MRGSDPGVVEREVHAAIESSPWFNRFGESFLENLLSDSFTILVLTIAARAGWGIAYGGWRLLRFYLGPAIARFPVPLEHLGAVTGDAKTARARVRVFCQIVRFGADDYIQNLASEQEKLEGRLQNRVLPVEMMDAVGGLNGSLLLPVHRRLGTQFKMFLVAPTPQHAERLMKTDYFKDPSRHAEQRGRRLWFTLDGVDTIQNTEKTTTNSIVYPSTLHDFTKRNGLGRLYCGVQRLRWRYAQRRRRRSDAVLDAAQHEC